ncbi:MAG: aminotransferase class V-fold PLP-dependent enzyme, partial [Planctomycetales bacterium]|nr:aminotransferase class V-fold PLP-dependent enzyme [Planctomycetales bacterium]
MDSRESPTSCEGAEQLRREFRAEMPVVEQYAYLDHAALGPLPRPALAAMQLWLHEASQAGRVPWPNWSAQVQQTRRLAAQFLDAGETEVALTSCTTAGINLVAEGVDWRAGDNIVTLADEFPSNLYPWMHQRTRGVDTRMVETNRGALDLSKLREACDSRTRVVAVSWIGYSTGCRRDLHAIAEVAHARGALFFVDAIQGLGAFPLSVADTPIDCLAAGGQKWLLGPEATGIAFFRRDKLDAIRPSAVGWKSMQAGFDYAKIEYNLRPDAARHEPSAMNMPGFMALGANLAMLSRWSQEARAGAILEISDYAVERLTGIGAQ